MTTGHATRCAEVIRVLALENETVRQAARQLLRRLVGIIGVIAAILISQQHMEHIVSIVVPLRIDLLREMRCVVMVLQHEMHMPPGLNGGAYRGSHLVHPVLLLDGVDCIET